MSCGALLYAVGGLTHPDIVLSALSSLGHLLIRILPALTLVFVLMVLMTLFIKKERLARQLSGARGWLASLLAAILGVLSVGSIYAWYPLLGDLKAKGVGHGPIAIFLYSRALKLPLLPIMIQYFGVAYTAALSVCIIAFSIISGLVVGKLFDTTR